MWGWSVWGCVRSDGAPSRPLVQVRGAGRAPHHGRGMNKCAGCPPWCDSCAQLPPPPPHILHPSSLVKYPPRQIIHTSLGRPPSPPGHSRSPPGQVLPQRRRQDQPHLHLQGRAGPGRTGCEERGGSGRGGRREPVRNQQHLHLQKQADLAALDVRCGGCGEEVWGDPCHPPLPGKPALTLPNPPFPPSPLPTHTYPGCHLGPHRQASGQPQRVHGQHAVPAHPLAL